MFSSEIINTLLFISSYQSLSIINYMDQRKRSTTNSNPFSSSPKNLNVFLLKKISLGSNSLGVSVDFSHYDKMITDASPTDKSTYSSIPIFNKDKRFFTPSFILSEDTAKFNDNEELCLKSHIRKARGLEQEKEEMYLPKPSKANSYCQVCREHFIEYLIHINEPSHLMKMKASPFYQDVYNLCEKTNPLLKTYKQKKIKKEKKRKTGILELREKNSRVKQAENLSTGLHLQEQRNPVY